VEKIVYTDKYYSLWLLLILVKDAIHRARQQELRQVGITSSEAGILFYAQALGNRATPAEISRHLFKRPHGISTLINRMEKKGLVRKVNDLDRKNLVRVELTAKGQQAYNHASERAVIHRIISSLPKKEIQQLSSSLEKLRGRAFDELGLKKKATYLGYER
jgi:MarR family multiple antibiotic resistance transcriptional regulator